MHYTSTRGGGTPRTFSEILLEGLAPDGGLYLPDHYPQVSADELESWRFLSYADLATEVLARFCDDIPLDDLRDIVHATYTPEVFGNARAGDDSAEIAPLHLLGEENGTQLFLLALSNGPTLAFKDLAMQLLGNLFEYQLARVGRELTILGATSGDTGSAAEYAMRGKHGIRVFMLSPHGRMSPFQVAQMFSLNDPNIVNLAVEGVFDDCQNIVKRVTEDAAFKVDHSIGVVNSINWARIVGQVIYYFHAWLRATDGPGQAVSFTVPSGNFGNVCAGHVARMMGLPIDTLVVATNENNVLDEFFTTGVYRMRPPADTFHTSSPSMDISRASNFERFVFDLVERDPVQLADLYRALDTDGYIDLSGTDAFARVAEFGFVSGTSTHADRVATIRSIDARYGITVDPHTADGLKVAREHLTPGIPMIALETAQPAKFGAIIDEALGHPPERPHSFEGLEAREQHFEVVPNDVDTIKRLIVERTAG
ncbi:MAG: threonine synthase [Salinibacterium sp.]|nr:threonine synthase [Salinibacterium sp.]